MRAVPLILLLFMGAASMAPAEARAEPTAMDGKARAKAFNEKAKRAFTLGKFEEAASLYEQAYEAHAAPVFLFNMGQCHRRMGGLEHLKRARFFLNGFLRESTDERARPEVEKQKAELEAKIKEVEAAKKKLEAAPNGPPPDAPAPVEPAPVKPTPVEPAPAANLVPAPPEQPASPPEDQSVPIYKKWWFWTVIGAVVVGVTVGGVVAATTGGDDRVPEGPEHPTSTFSLTTGAIRWGAP